jgi:hypothetical protein
MGNISKTINVSKEASEAIDWLRANSPNGFNLSRFVCSHVIKEQEEVIKRDQLESIRTSGGCDGSI